MITLERIISIFPLLQLEPLLRLASDLEEPGAGMGLALARRVVERWGGTLELHSVPGEGTTVTLEWPRP